MKLFLISQEENTGYDTYDSAVVCAESEEDAKTICPEYNFYQLVDGYFIRKPINHPEQANPKNIVKTWASKPENVKVEYLGEAKEGSEKGVICASFNAG